MSGRLVVMIIAVILRSTPVLVQTQTSSSENFNYVAQGEQQQVRPF